MPKSPSKVPYGNRQARALCTMSYKARLDFVAEGLPIILESAQGFWDAALQLKDSPREASVLEGFAEEEAAKALILVDLVRCPPAKVSTRVGRIVGKIFYDHLARLIYAKAQRWRPASIAQLQDYVDHERQGHYLEGALGEYILPNWALYSRESTMYADIEVYEDEKPLWSAPGKWPGTGFHKKPVSLEVAEALDAVGAFTRAGVQATADIWGQVDFIDTQGLSVAQELTRSLAARLDAEGLVKEAAAEHHVRVFYDRWQWPMYNLEFGKIDVPLEDLKAAQEANLRAEFGCDHGDP